MTRNRRICRCWRTCITPSVRRMKRKRSTSPPPFEIYVTGSLNVFNHHTNVDVNSRIVCYDIKELGKQLKKNRDAGGAGSGLEPCDHQPRRP